MVNEIVTFHIGQAGINCGAAIWRLITKEQSIGLDCKPDDSFYDADSDHGRLQTLFTELSDGRYVPRGIFVDSESYAMDSEIKTSNLKYMFTEEFCVNGKQDASNCFPRGRFLVTKAIHPEVMVAVRRAVESCEMLGTGFYYASNCGGTGSGYGCAFLEAMNDMLPRVSLHSHMLVPSKNIASNNVEPFNSLLSLTATREWSSVKMLYDNETMYNLLFEVHSKQNIQTCYGHINHIIAQVASGITSTIRWNGQLSSDLTHFETNLVPFPSCNLVCSALVPLQTPTSRFNITTYGLTSEAFLTNKEMCGIDTIAPEHQYISCVMLYRGNVNARAIATACHEVKTVFQVPFVPWVPTGFKVGISPKGVCHDHENYDIYKPEEQSLLKISNHTAMSNVTDYIVEHYTELLDKRAFVFWFISEGMEEGEFVDAVERIADQKKDMAKLLQGALEADEPED